MDALGPEQVLRLRAPLRLHLAVSAVPAVAIGAGEGTLLEMTSAYSAFPNQGVRMTPYQC